ncbi:MAG: hypothetical protein ACP5RH_01130 [Leptodesmis sp.]|uniref:hypothetical protein n=1 Tax=Leptodesmis sp. TaxID=3100501 RepID=UPI003D1416F0
MLVSKLAKQRIQQNNIRISTCKSPLAYAADKAKQRLQELSQIANSRHRVDPRIPTEWEEFAALTLIQTGGTIAPFIPYDFQIKLIRQIEANQNIVICKSRQMGVSETICSWLLMRALTEPGFSAVIFSKTQDDSSQLGQRIRDMALSLGNLCPKLQTESQTKLAFKGLGRLYFMPVTARAARGMPSVSVVLFDEAGFIDGIDSVYQAAVPTLSMLGNRGKVIFVSTPNGRNGLFYRLLISGPGEAKRLLDECKAIVGGDVADCDRVRNHMRMWSFRKWTKVLLHWRCHPIYGTDPDWAEKTRIERQLTEAQWDQEYELDFLDELRAVFNLDLVEKCAIGQWKPPVPGHRYIAGIDPNFGGGDFFTAGVIDISTKPYELVAEYHENRRGKDYNIAQAVALMSPYRPLCISVESNSGGVLYVEEISKLKPGWKVEPVCTTNLSKLTNTDRIVLLMERDQFIYPADSAFAQEAPFFIETMQGSTRYRGAESGKHDDGVMAVAVAFASLDAHAGVDTVSLLGKVLN